MSGARITQDVARDPVEQLQSLDTRFLPEIKHGDAYMLGLARHEFMKRGFNGDGRRVGFAKDGEMLGI